MRVENREEEPRGNTSTKYITILPFSGNILAILRVCRLAAIPFACQAKDRKVIVGSSPIARSTFFKRVFL